MKAKQTITKKVQLITPTIFAEVLKAILEVADRDKRQAQQLIKYSK